MKKIIIIVLIFGVLAGGAFMFISKGNQGVTQKELSARSKEFLKKQQSEGNLEFSGVNSSKDKTGDIKELELVEVGECFDIDIPFAIESKKELGPCFNQLMISSPRGMINVYTREVSFQSLEDDPGVKMRRNEAKSYKEEKHVIKGKTFIIFKRTDAGYEKTALYLQGGKLFSLNLLTNFPNDSTDRKFLDMLESVDFRD